MTASSSHWPVHQLWPEGNQSSDLDVIFFHGLQLTASDNDAWSSTWTQRGHDDVCWPRDWLPFDLEKAVRIFSVSYNAHVVTSPHKHVSDIVDNLLQTLINPRYKWHHPIVLIGHSFGGLVLKSLVVEVERRLTFRNSTDSWSKSTAQCAKVFLKNVRGVAFYGVPHSGSSNFPQYVNNVLRLNNIHYPGLMKNILPWERDMEQLTGNFNRVATANKFNIYAFCEGRPVEQLGILVDFSSAQRLAGDNSYKVEDANHMEVCKPPSKEHPSYKLLLQFIVTCRAAGRQAFPALQELRDLPKAMFGLENNVERVVTLLTAEGKNADPCYVKVWGMGGVGKTLLLERVFERIKDHFEEAIFLTVGQTPDIIALYQTLSIKLDVLQLYVRLEDYKRSLRNEFIEKRVLLVLDDVWEDRTFDSLNLAVGEGSVTLLSTRNLSIVNRAELKINELNVKPLSKEDSWSLFSAHAFRPPSNVPCEIEAVAQSVAQECQGLALALKIIGRGMFGKTSLKLHWVPILKKLRKSRLQEKIVKEELYERLKVGYDLLSEEDYRLNRCFHYFAAFPEKSEICFEEILFHWVGEGLLSTDDEDDPTEEAFSLLHKLWERSFIESNGQSAADILELMKFKYALNFKLHDVMRDLAFYILHNDCDTLPAQLYFYRPGQNLGEVPKDWKTLSEARRLSLDMNKLQQLPDSFRAPKLLFLLLGRNSIKSLPSNFSSNFPVLRVLNLSNGQFHNLPAELGNLKDLVFLDLSNCHDLQILPDTIRNLHELQFLILDNCWSLKYLPSEMSYLTSLQVLHTAACEELSWAEYSLSQQAREGFAGDFYSTVGASLEDICGLNCLTELTIFGQNHPALEATELPQNKLPHNICALTNLQLLQIWLSIDSLPAQLASFVQLQELEIQSPMLRCLPTSFTSRESFPALIKLKLCSYKLVELPEVENGALPKLEKLDLTDCTSLTILPLSLQLLTNLKILIVVDTLQNHCSLNCKISSIWKMWDIRFSKRQAFTFGGAEFGLPNCLDVTPLEIVNSIGNSREYTFDTHHRWSMIDVTNFLRKKRQHVEKQTEQFAKEQLAKEKRNEQLAKEKKYCTIF